MKQTRKGEVEPVRHTIAQVDPDKGQLTPEQMDGFFSALGLPKPSEQSEALRSLFGDRRLCRRQSWLGGATTRSAND